MMLEINIFHDDKGGNPELVRESQRRRFASIDVVDEIIQLDKAWRQRQFELEGLRKEFNRINKEVARLKIAREDVTEMIKSMEENKRQAAKKELEVQAAKAELDAKLGAMGNLVHDSVPFSTDEANNEVVRTWGDKRMEEKLKNHVDLVNLLGIADLEKDVVEVLEGGDLKSLGMLDYGKSLTHPFTAHPKVDPITDEMFTFGYSHSPPYVTYGVITKRGWYAGSVTNYNFRSCNDA